MSNGPSDRIRAWRAMMHIHATVINAIDQTLREEVGIPGAWYEALVEISLNGGAMRMNEFAQETTLTRSGATRFADRLEEAGLVERRSCPSDRRGWELVLTDKGRITQRASAPYVLAAIDEHFGRHIDNDEAGVLATALGRVQEALAPV